MKEILRVGFSVESYYERKLEEAKAVIKAQREEIERQEIEIEDLRCTIVDLETKLAESKRPDKPNPNYKPPASESYPTITLRIILE